MKSIKFIFCTMALAFTTLMSCSDDNEVDLSNRKFVRIDQSAVYVDPCMYGEALTGGYVNKSFIDIEKIVDANCPKGKAAFTIAGYYTMGTTGVRVNEYDQTKAMENADLIIASCYANGRAVDDNVAVIFDVTKLEEYVLPVTQATIVQAGQE